MDPVFPMMLWLLSLYFLWPYSATTIPVSLLVDYSTYNEDYSKDLGRSVSGVKVPKKTCILLRSRRRVALNISVVFF